MTYDVNALAEIDRIKRQLDLAQPESFYTHSDTIRALAALQQTIASSGGGGGGGAITITSQAIEDGAVAANTKANAITVATSTRMLVTDAGGTTTGGSKTIATGSWYYQIYAEQGTFTLSDGSGVVYDADGLRPGTDRPPMANKAYPAITITPGNNSRIFVEECR